MTGKKGTYPVVEGDEPLRVAITLGDGEDALQGLCGESAFVPGDCVLNAPRTALTCRR